MGPDGTRFSFPLGNSTVDAHVDLVAVVSDIGFGSAGSSTISNCFVLVFQCSCYVFSTHKLFVLDHAYFQGPHVCSMCQMEFELSSQMKLHQNSEHPAS